MAVVVVLRAVAISIGRAAAYYAMLKELSASAAPRGPWMDGPTCYSELLFTCISIVVADGQGGAQ